MNPQILSIGTAVPSNKFTQKQLCEFMQPKDSNQRKERLIFQKIFGFSGIETRHTIVNHFGSEGDEGLYSEAAFPSISKRMEVFQKNALSLSKNAVDECINAFSFDKRKITHVITFSCTGMYAPGLDVELVHKLDLCSSVERTSINFMGCYAAFNALKSAYHITRSEPDSNVLIVGVELCSLHYVNENTEEQITAKAIFSDGAAAALISANEDFKGPSLELKKFYSEFAFNAREHMTWSIGDYAFNLRLSSYVPDAIRNGIGEMSEKLFAKTGLSKNDISFYAIHPGGIKILQACEDALNITPRDNAISYDVLKNFGNMSSVTVLFVLKEYLKKITAEDSSKNILSCAFGPGLTMESMILGINY